jgi:hypothetical protein
MPAVEILSPSRPTEADASSNATSVFQSLLQCSTLPTLTGRSGPNVAVNDALDILLKHNPKY